MAARGKIIDLRKLLAERFPQALLSSSARLTTGLAALDSVMEGGLPKGAITELISPQFSAGSASLIAALLQAAERDRYFLALIDGRDSFDPQPLGNACLRHLLWARCSQALEAIKAADLLLRDGNFPLLVLDVALNSPNELRKIPQITWYRLQRLVETTSSALVVVSRRSMVSSAKLKLVLENTWTLSGFEQENALAHLPIRLQRVAMAGSEISQARAS